MTLSVVELWMESLNSPYSIPFIVFCFLVWFFIQLFLNYHFREFNTSDEYIGNITIAFLHGTLLGGASLLLNIFQIYLNDDKKLNFYSIFLFFIRILF